MGDLLATGIQWLGAQRTLHCSSPVTYRRGDTEAVVNATFGHTEYEVQDDYGATVVAEVADFLILAADLAAVFGEPKVGDRIAAGDVIYEVMPLASGGHWRWSDPYRTTMRIHTKQAE